MIWGKENKWNGILKDIIFKRKMKGWRRGLSLKGMNLTDVRGLVLLVHCDDTFLTNHSYHKRNRVDIVVFYIVHNMYTCTSSCPFNKKNIHHYLQKTKLGNKSNLKTVFLEAVYFSVVTGETFNANMLLLCPNKASMSLKGGSFVWWENIALLQFLNGNLQRTRRTVQINVTMIATCLEIYRRGSY